MAFQSYSLLTLFVDTKTKKTAAGIKRSKQAFTIAALYHFAKIEEPDHKKDPLLELCRTENVVGTIILAEEGINGTISGPVSGIKAVLDHLHSWTNIDEIEVKYSYNENSNFNRL